MSERKNWDYVHHVAGTHMDPWPKEDFEYRDLGIKDVPAAIM